MVDADHGAAKSGLSGEIIPAGEAQEVIVKLADGQIRQIFVTHEESARILRSGRDLTPRWRRLVFGMRAPSAVLVAAVIAGLVLPALTRQWSDRQREFDAKETLIQKINSTVDSSIWLARNVARGGLPVVQRRNFACSRDPSGPKCASAREQTAITQATRLALSEDSLRRRATGVAADLRLYFPSARQSGQDIATVWTQYVGAILAYQQLASDVCGKDRASKFAALQRWFGSSPLVYNQLETPLGARQHTPPDKSILRLEPACKAEHRHQLDKSGGFVQAYGAAGDQMLLAGARMAAPLVNSNGRGFSDTPSDFAHDVGYVTIAFLILALLWTVGLYIFRALMYWPRTFGDD